MARSAIGDAADMLKAFPQMTYNEYMYERSWAQMQLMANDSTHIHYLKGKDKKIWDNYNEIIKSQKMLESLFQNSKTQENNK